MTLTGPEHLHRRHHHHRRRARGERLDRTRPALTTVGTGAHADRQRHGRQHRSSPAAACSRPAIGTAGIVDGGRRQSRLPVRRALSGAGQCRPRRRSRTSRARRRWAAPRSNAVFAGSTSRSSTPSCPRPAAYPERSRRAVNTNLPRDLSDSLSYDANNAFLNLNLNFAASGRLTGNQQASATRSTISSTPAAHAYGICWPVRPR